MIGLDFRRGNIQADPGYMAVVDYMKNFDYKNTKVVEHADWVLEYAETQYKSMLAYVRYLDEKADVIVRYFGLLVGVGALIGSIQHRSFPIPSLLIGAASVLCWIISVVCALSVRYPIARPFPPTVPRVFKYIIETEATNAAKTKLSLAYEKITTGLAIVGQRKARGLQSAYSFMICGMVVLLGFVVTLFWF